MSVQVSFERQCAAVGTTELWSILKEKSEAEGLDAAFLEAVGAVCGRGVTLAKDIIRFFPTFTLHDETHIANVCSWMVRLLGDRKGELSAHEAALLVMAACCHDIGMSVSADQEKALRGNPQSADWKEYFKRHLREEEEFSRTGTVSDQTLRSFVRVNHHKRIAAQLPPGAWPDALTRQGISRGVLLRLCQSHGEALDSLQVPRGKPYDLRLCAVLLRLADSLDFDSGRAPADLFRHLGLEHPENFEQAVSQAEWAKNRAGCFGQIRGGIIPFTASFSSLQLECEVQAYLDWTQRELEEAGEYLSGYAGPWQTLALPRRISTDCVERNGYQFGKFCLTMDQDRILKLLTGRNLYSDPGVFVRELLQNAIDAVLTRSSLDPHFAEQDGRIVIRSWVDREGYSWFRIEDNGIGMDDHIITDYFLKVGRSYYTSDEFRADKRHYGRGADYNPISRFGIGILSCFMSDPEHNLLEVSTKRYTQDVLSPSPAIRLNVTGLHGYYYLAAEQAQAEDDEFFQPMHNPQGENEGYRSETGTTLCVRVNLYQLGGYRSFKEIVDKYVQFPEVPVEYFGPEGHAVYATQDQLMDAVHALNPGGPDGEIKTYVHPISDAAFARLQRELPHIVWQERPAVTLQYAPLDWLSGSESLKGVAVFAGLRASVSAVPLRYQGKDVLPEFECHLENSASYRSFLLKFTHNFPYDVREELQYLEQHMEAPHQKSSAFDDQVRREYPQFQHDPGWRTYILKHYQVSQKQLWDKIRELEQLERDRDAVENFYRLEGMRSIEITHEELLAQLCGEESAVFRHVIAALDAARPQPPPPGSFTRTAYNGVLADTSDLLGKSEQCIGLLLLLRGAFCPEVNLARDTIDSLPLEAACTLALVRHAFQERVHFVADAAEPAHKKTFALLSERELRLVLEKHPGWEAGFRFQDRSLAELRRQLQEESSVDVGSFRKGFLYDALRLTALKKHFTVYKDSSKYWDSPYITGAPGDSSALDFPVSLFFAPPRPEAPLCGYGPQHFWDNIGGINCYNRDHRFSRWLIRHGEALRRQVPGIYNDLLKLLVSGDGSDQLMEPVNASLKRLREFQNNRFEVTEALFLQAEDFDAGGD